MNQTLTPTEFIAVCNQSLDYAYANIAIEGEIASFKISQGKWVFFDLKDQESSLGCFMTLYQMRLPLTDGMQVRLIGTPKLTKWGKFSITVRNIAPIGEGNLKKSYELLKAKLNQEGLFAPEKKRPLPPTITKIGVISSTQAAGYADFIKILNERWGGLKIKVAHTGVQGLAAADQIIRALSYLNETADLDVIAILRGGGSADDLAVFNDEQLVRAIARSKTPVITGIGHEVDETLADLAADVRASTPSNAAQILTPDRAAEIASLHQTVSRLSSVINGKIYVSSNNNRNQITALSQFLLLQVAKTTSEIYAKVKLLERLNPKKILAEGYALVTGQLAVGNVVKITTSDTEAKAKIESIRRLKT